MPPLDLSPGELFDRQAILELKAQHAPSAERQAAAIRELDAVTAALADVPAHEVYWHVSELRRINAYLWQLEDDVRALLTANDLGTEFIKIAARIPRLNDERARCKTHINQKLGAATAIDDKVYTSGPPPRPTSGPPPRPPSGQPRRV